MNISRKMAEEVRTLSMVMLYFGASVGVLLIFKKLVLSEYDISFSGLSAALVGTLVLSKVVLVLENVSFGDWIKTRPAWVEVLLRTLLYTAGVFVVMFVEKSFEGRTEHGGFVPAMAGLFSRADINHVLANALFFGGVLFIYNLLSIFRVYLGPGGVVGILMTPPATISKEKS